MNNFFTLVMISSNQLFSKSAAIKKNKRAKGVAGKYFFLILFGAIMMLGFFLPLYIGIADFLKESGNYKFIIHFAVLIFSVFCLLSTTFSAQGYIFKSKDLDLLFSLPINQYKIFLAKFSTLYLHQLSFAFVSVVPAIYIYFRFVPFDIIKIAVAVFSLFLAPLFPLFLGTLISFITAVLTRRLKYKNLFLLFFYSALLVCYFVFMMQDMNGLADKVINNIDFINKFSYLNFSAEWLADALSGKYYYFIFFILYNILPVAVVFPFLAKKYVPVRNYMSESKIKNNYKLKSQRQEKPLYSMIKKELGYFFSNAIYIMNAMSGSLIITIASVLAVFNKSSITELINNPEIADMIDTSSVFPFFVTIALIFLFGLTSTTNVSISLEGKKLWIYKSLPVEVADIFKAKAAVNIICAAPFIILNSVLLSNACGISVLNCIMIIIIVFSSLTFSALLGLVLNLAKPKLDFTNETVVIKQSASVIFQMLIGILSVIVTGILAAVSFIFGFNIYFTALFLLFNGLNCFFIHILSGWGVKRFNNLIGN